MKWVNLVKLKGKSIWEVNVDDSDSGTWKAIMELRGKIRKCIWYEVGDGKKINVWHDKWHINGPLDEFISFKERYEARFKEQMTIDEAVVNNDWVWPESCRQQNSVLNSIEVPSLTNGKDDTILWMGANGKKGKFSLKCVWDEFIEDNAEVNWYKVVWFVT